LGGRRGGDKRKWWIFGKQKESIDKVKTEGKKGKINAK
jgi:hypothetical protein